MDKHRILPCLNTMLSTDQEVHLMSHRNFVSRYNREGYLDITAYLVIRKIDGERRREQRKPQRSGRKGRKKHVRPSSTVT